MTTQPVTPTPVTLPQPQPQPQGGGLNIPPPSRPLQPLPPPQPGTSPGSPSVVVPVTPEPTSGLTGNDIAIGAGVMVVAAIVFFFLRGAVRSHLIDRRARPSAAGSAGWALFSFLFLTTGVVLFGTLGSLWQELAFVIPAAVVLVISLVLFVIMYLGAASQGRHSA